MAVQEVEIILCIPGPWKNRSELLERIIKDSDGYIFAGAVLMHMESKQGFMLEYEGADERMLSAFEAAGRHWKNTPEMQLIADHHSVCYLIAKGGSLESAHEAMDAANGLLKAGGYGVKVESSGIAHSPKSWAEQCQYKHLFESHKSYVIYIMSDHIYSCGMHCFGLPDAIVNATDSDDPVELLRIFTLYLLSECPIIKDGQTFSTDMESPIYRIRKSTPIDYGEDSLFNNPYGMWELQKNK